MRGRRESRRHPVLQNAQVSLAVVAADLDDGQGVQEPERLPLVGRHHVAAWVQLFWSEIARSGSECVLSLLGAGVEALVFAGEVEAPVLLEVAVADHGAEGEDGFGAVQAPSRASDAETVGDQVRGGMLPR